MEQYDKFLTDNNSIFLYGEITNKTASHINQKLIYLDRLKLEENKELVKEKKPIDPIFLWINSKGGSVTDGLSIIDTMGVIHIPVCTVIHGSAFSMAGIISISGDKRLSTINSSWMLHDTCGAYSDYTAKLRAKFQHGSNLQNQIMDIIKTKTKLRKKQLDTAKHYDLYLNSSECKKYKIIDDILER